jgi:hypothetical protein
MIRKWVRSVLVGIDQLVNAFLLGDEDETISSRMAKKRDTNLFCRQMCRVLDFVDKNHCDKNIEPDEGDKI